ncbi:MAG: alanine--tRNA ligase [Anaerolineales bacterium]|nr:alanine--tRNA ligase [Anaerolineales bacterium]
MSSKGSGEKRKWTGREVREAFLDFFAEQGHKIVPSSSLVPVDDPTLLFTNAGMVQFKDVFLGTGTRPYTRATDSQKCMRVAGKHNDLDDVGRDDSHHTFFEMLGNWSFGDYYKEEAITWAWQLLTDIWELPKERLWATVFEDEKGEIPRDDEAAEIWSRQPGFVQDHILFFGREENFWEMAEKGPCGPDSEIHYDRGEEYCEKQEVEGHVCMVNGDCGRYLELWNLVFIQYNRVSPTELVPLPMKHVDTGMGFERIVSVLQDVDSNYKTDLFTPMMDQIQEMAGHSDDDREQFFTPYRVIADHSRAAAFLIADGVVPGNTGRNYVCRMVIRRASRFGSMLDFNEPFLASIANTVIESYGDVYPELVRNRAAILQTITEEEIRFRRTVDVGLSRLESYIQDLKTAGEKILPGDDAFDLYATYGLPLEISRDVAREDGLEVDEVGFSESMDAHRFVSGAGRDLGELSEEDATLYQELLTSLKDSSDLDPEGVLYNPYDDSLVEGSILAILYDGELVEEADTGDRILLLIPETHFYLEAGGQVSDKGTIQAIDKPSWNIDIEDVVQPVDGLILHSGLVTQGKPRRGDAFRAVVDHSRRLDIMRNHTATHLLHAGLQSILGEHARQAGSLVAPDRLRFDFTHPTAMTVEELDRLETIVNESILGDYEVQVGFSSQKEALESGAMALFGETYGETVRTITVAGEERISYELCGGTHVPRTSVVGSFLILNEGSVAAGIRRIEAVTGRGAIELMRSRRGMLQRLATRITAPVESLEDRIDLLITERDKLLKSGVELRARLAFVAYQSLELEDFEGVSIKMGTIPDADMDTLRKLTDRFRDEHQTGIIVLASDKDQGPLIVAAVSRNLVDLGISADELVKVVAAEVGGSGGGRSDMAQAGGGDVERLLQAFESGRDWIRSKLT